MECKGINVDKEELINGFFRKISALYTCETKKMNSTIIDLNELGLILRSGLDQHMQENEGVGLIMTERLSCISESMKRILAAYSNIGVGLCASCLGCNVLFDRV